MSVEYFKHVGVQLVIESYERETLVLCTDANGNGLKDQRGTVLLAADDFSLNQLLPLDRLGLRVAAPAYALRCSSRLCPARSNEQRDIG